MSEAQPIPEPRSPFDGLVMADVPEVARMLAAPMALLLVLRADARTARSLFMTIGLPLPPSINRFEASTSGELVMQLGPDEWIVRAAEGAARDLMAKVEAVAAGSGLTFGFIDISHRMATLELAGPGVTDILAAGCPLPLDMAKFPIGRATRTIFHKTEVVLWRNAADRFHIACNRSFLSYLTQHLAEVIRAEAALAKREGRGG